MSGEDGLQQVLEDLDLRNDHGDGTAAAGEEMRGEDGIPQTTIDDGTIVNSIERDDVDDQVVIKREPASEDDDDDDVLNSNSKDGTTVNPIKRKHEDEDGDDDRRVVIKREPAIER